MSHSTGPSLHSRAHRRYFLQFLRICGNVNGLVADVYDYPRPKSPKIVDVSYIFLGTWRVQNIVVFANTKPSLISLSVASNYHPQMVAS